MSLFRLFTPGSLIDPLPASKGETLRLLRLQIGETPAPERARELFRKVPQGQAPRYSPRLSVELQGKY
jgi:hypothetical protein